MYWPLLLILVPFWVVWVILVYARVLRAIRRKAESERCDCAVCRQFDGLAIPPHVGQIVNG